MQVIDIFGSHCDIGFESIDEKMIEEVSFAYTSCNLFWGRVFTAGGHQFHLTDLIASLRSIDFEIADLKMVSRIVTVFSKAEEVGYEKAEYLGKGWLAKAVADIKHWFSRRERDILFKAIVRKVHKKSEQDPEVLLNLAKYYLEGSRKNKTLALEYLSVIPQLSTAKELFLLHFPEKTHLGEIKRDEILLSINISENSPAELCYELGKYHWRQRRETDEFHKYLSKHFLEIAYSKNHAPSAYHLYLNHAAEDDQKKQWFDKAIELGHPLALLIEKKLKWLEDFEVAEASFEADRSLMKALARAGCKDAIDYIKHAKTLKMLQGSGNQSA